MKKAIFFKEWIKTRWYLLAALVVFVSYTLYLILRVGNAIEFKGAAHLWAILLTRALRVRIVLLYCAIAAVLSFLVGIGSIFFLAYHRPLELDNRMAEYYFQLQT